MVEQAFPDAIDFYGEDSDSLEVQRGMEGTYVAEVVDRGLQDALGKSEAQIRYDLRNWVIATQVPGGEPLLRARVRVAPSVPDGELLEEGSVLAARIHLGRGTVVFTSFHNETQSAPFTQPTNDMLRILEDIILSL